MKVRYSPFMFMAALVAIALMYGCATPPGATGEAEVLAVTIGPTSVTIDQGQSVVLVAKVVYSSGPVDGNVGWSSSDVSVASVSDDGIVVGVGEGTAAIIATAVRDPSKSQTFVVVVSAAVGAEGSASNPVVVQVDVPHRGRVDTGTSYYVAEVTPDAAYQVELTDLSDDVDVYVYEDENYDYQTASSDRESTESESLTVRASGAYLYIAADGSYTDEGASFTLIVSEFAVTRETTPYAGSVDTGMGHYSVDVVPGELYEISLTDLTDDADLFVYNNDGSFSYAAVSSEADGVSPEFVVVQSLGDVMYIGIDGSYSTDGTPFTLDVVKVETVPITTFPYVGTVDGNRMYYAVAVEYGVTYEITLVDLSDDVDLYVYGEPDVGVPSTSMREGTEQEAVIFTPYQSVVYVAVDGTAAAGQARFTMGLEEFEGGFESEGSVEFPIPVSVGEPYRGQVGLGKSYYVVDVEANVAYSVSIEQMGDDADLYWYDEDSLYETSVDSSEAEGLIDEYLSVQSSGDVMYISVDGSYTENGTRFTLTVAGEDEGGR